LTFLDDGAKNSDEALVMILAGLPASPFCGLSSSNEKEIWEVSLDILRQHYPEKLFN
jgi:hypothetical protein